MTAKVTQIFEANADFSELCVIFFPQYSIVLSETKKFPTFESSNAALAVDDRHTESVFALSLTENVAVFQKVRGQRTALISCLDHGPVHFLRRTPYLFECGVLRRLFLHGFCYNLPLDRRNHLHTLLYYKQPMGDVRRLIPLV